MLKKLKSLFVIEEEVDEKPLESKNVTPQPSVQSTPTPSSKPKVVSASEIKTNVKPDSKFLNSLLSAVEANNLQGFDYLEYKQSLQSLAKMEMDEKTRYESAFAMAKTMGANKDKLIKAGQHYINILSQEQAKFLEAYQGQLVRAKGTDNIKNLESGISQKEKQIEELTKQISEEKRLLDKQKNQVNQSVAKVQLTKDKFMSAYAIVAGQIEQDIKKMQAYLK